MHDPGVKSTSIPTMDGTLLDAYQQWWRAVRPAGVGDRQTEEMHRAFYAGAMCMFALVMRTHMQDDDAGILTIDRLNLELGEWLAHVNAQAAAEAGGLQ